jgi:hypothetical protein
VALLVLCVVLFLTFLATPSSASASPTSRSLFLGAVVAFVGLRHAEVERTGVQQRRRLARVA